MSNVVVGSLQDLADLVESIKMENQIPYFIPPVSPISEIRIVEARHVETCEHGYTHVDPETHLTVIRRCPQGHWTWADGKFCVACNESLELPS